MDKFGFIYGVFWKSENLVISSLVIYNKCHNIDDNQRVYYLKIQNVFYPTNLASQKLSASEITRMPLHATSAHPSVTKSKLRQDLKSLKTREKFSFLTTTIDALFLVHLRKSSKDWASNGAMGE